MNDLRPMSLVAPAALLCASLLVAEALRQTSPIPSAIALVALGVVTSLVATRPSLSAVLLGAAAAVAYALLRELVPTAAGAAFVALLVGPRAIRAFTSLGRILVISLSTLAGAVGSFALASAEHAGPERLIGALLVTSFVMALPLTISADDPIGGALRAIARKSRGGSRVMVLRAVALRRRLATALHRPTRAEGKAIEATFARLVELGEARVEALAGGPTLERAMRAQLVTLVGCVRALDRRAAEHEGLEAQHDDRLASHRRGAETEANVLAELSTRTPETEHEVH
jgi:hypothetical protein